MNTNPYIEGLKRRQSDMLANCARIVAIHAEQGAPLDSFLDTYKASDLSDLALDLGVSIADVQEAQNYLRRQRDRA